jgi:signal transduction histidine kinase
MKRMTLQRRFLLQNLLLVGGMLAAGGVSVWRLWEVNREVNVSHSIYAELQTVGNVAVYTGTAQGLLSDPQANRKQIALHLTNAIAGLDQFIHVSQGYGAVDHATMQAYVPIDIAAASARDRLQSVFDLLNKPSAAGSDADALRKSVEAALNDIHTVASSCVGFIRTRQETASGHLVVNLILIGVFSILAVLAAVLLSLSQYRLVMAPLQRLRTGVGKLAAAQFAEKLDAGGMGKSAEFLDLAAEFNRMAGELDGFYRRLEEQVRLKSQELVRSERLASVGFLAAGVAHEINNPLNIISGYAELTIRRLESADFPADDEAASQARNNLRIIREEAFRCKEITDKLLSLSRNGSQDWQELDLANVARDVAAMTKGLKNYRDRRLIMKLDPAEPLHVRANLTEMKQVLLNLTINALEAAPPGHGEVCIEGRRSHEWIELSVKDNGRGMCAEVLSHVFEPFFTARRAGGERAPGNGLGLSITHAIIENHHGRIEAASDGPGRGARFTVRLPAMAGVS